MRLDYGLFMAEQEGYLQQDKIETAINEFVSLTKEGVDINDYQVQDRVFDACGIKTLNKKEKEYIVNKILRKTKRILF